ncbi:MAG: sigma-70 family RNA polymerase sigma factor [Verrucomicrobiota bacterium]
MGNSTTANWRGTYTSTRRSLVEKLKDWEDQESWEEFYRRYWKLIYSTAIQAGLREDEASDVVQETILAIARQSKDQRYDPSKGSFKGWLFNLTRWRIADQWRKRQRHDREKHPGSDPGRDTATFDRFESPGNQLEKAWDREWHASLLERGLSAVKKRVSAIQYQIYHSHVIQEWPVSQVMERLGVTRAQVYLAKHRVGQLLKKDLSRLENQNP